MNDCAARRKLQISTVGSSVRTDLFIEIGLPCFVKHESVDFETDEEEAACDVIISGLEEPLTEMFYGADPLQALKFAVDIDPVIRRLCREHDVNFTTGESYFRKPDAGYLHEGKSIFPGSLPRCPGPRPGRKPAGSSHAERT